jgi:hypothetical protein
MQWEQANCKQNIWQQSTKKNEPVILQLGAKEKKPLETHCYFIMNITHHKKKKLVETV